MRCPGGVLTHLARCLLTGLPDGGPILRSSGVTGRSAVIIPTLSTLSPMAFSILTASGSSFVGRGVESDSHPGRLACWLYHLLVWSCWPTGQWLMDGWCHLRNTQHRSPWCLSLLYLSLLCLRPLCLSPPVQSVSHLCRPPNGRSVLWRCR